MIMTTMAVIMYLMLSVVVDSLWGVRRWGVESQYQPPIKLYYEKFGAASKVINWGVRNRLHKGEVGGRVCGGGDVNGQSGNRGWPMSWCCWWQWQQFRYWWLLSYPPWFIPSDEQYKEGYIDSPSPPSHSVMKFSVLQPIHQIGR